MGRQIVSCGGERKKEKEGEQKWYGPIDFPALKLVIIGQTFSQNLPVTTL